jgi:hypothetical protein
MYCIYIFFFCFGTRSLQFNQCLLHNASTYACIPLAFLRLLQGVVMFALLYQQPLKYDEYLYPNWAEWIGWTLALSSILMIPLFAFISMLQTPGTLKEVSVNAFCPTTGFP